MDGLSISNLNNQVQSAEGFKEALSKTQQNKINSQGGESFGDTLKQAINSVDNLQKDADAKMQQLATGKSQNIHDTMIAAEKADLALRLMLQVRNKIVDAYQEIMKMQV